MRISVSSQINNPQTKDNSAFVWK